LLTSLSYEEKKRAMQGKECIIETRNYDPNSEVCDEKLCCICKNGTWQEKGALDFLVGGP